VNRMKQLREEQGLNMKEAARRLGLPYTTYVNYEKGLREPNSEMLINIANFYNCSIDYLVCKSPDRTDDSTLDAVSETDPFLLKLTGNIFSAQKAKQMIDAGELDQAQLYLSHFTEPEVAEMIAHLNLEVSDVDTHMQQLLHYFPLLNAQGQERLCRYAEELTGHPAYQKKKPSEEG